MDYIIRSMEKKDIEQVALIEKSIFSIPWSADSFTDASETETNIYLVCCEGNQVVGYCGLWTVLGEGNITNVAVSENYRGKGYGKALMQELEKRALEKNVKTLFLEVRESNQKARNLYASLGYNNIGTRKNFYERPIENAVIMSKMIYDL